nr:valine--tRNA ligase [Nanoarchaeum sp.]
MANNYDFKESEKKWSKYWEEEGIYDFDGQSDKETYSIDTPPPTVSGAMHLGHAFSYSHEDFVARYQRMKQKNVFYPFGTDDNGLPTERLIEKLKNVRSTEVDRTEFVKLCQDTVAGIRPNFIQDWKNIGMSCDFNKSYSTIDNHCIRTSQLLFMDLHKKGLAYQKSAPTMWCVKCQTAIAQAELEDEELNSTFNDIIFKVGTENLIIATTRPELIPACVCIYVHPDDFRYKQIVGKKAKIPLFHYEVPIFADESVEKEKGSGAMMICSYGDKYDVEAITKRSLEPRVVIEKNGVLNHFAAKYKGMNIKDARRAILDDLEKEKLLVNKKPIQHVVNVHDKCGTEIEFLSSKQWFVKILENKKKLIKSADKIKWHPEFMKTRYVNWVEALEWDWCISRQRAYGVPFPIWYCKKCGKEMLADIKQLPVFPLENEPTKKCSCGSDKFIAEQDVMDTWATSSLSPQIVCNFIEDEEYNINFGKTYPMSLRPQAHDIIRTWAFYTIARGLYHHNKEPWSNIMISGHVLDPKGKKMSKSKGNVVEPQKVIQTYGADALRFWAANASLGKDLSYKEEDIKTALRTITKLWNASNFAFLHLTDFKNKKMELELIDKGILSKFNDIIKECTDAFDNYEYSKSKMLTEIFFWSQLCDNYLEITKDRLYNPDKRGVESRKSAQYVLYQLLLGVTKLFAPIMPYISEEIYQTHFVKSEKEKSIHISKWPKYDKKLKDEIAEKTWDKFVEILSFVRQEKAKNKLSLTAEVKLIITEEDNLLLSECLQDLKAVCKAKDIDVGEKMKVEF